MGHIPVSLEVLRERAREELAAVARYRLEHGEDPAQFSDELPSVDEMVITLLRAETISAHGLDEARARAYHPAARREDTETFEYQLLRQIALDRPSLTPTVWRMLGRMNQAA